MAAHPESEQAAARSALLTPHEQAVCQQMAAGVAPHSQRAQALLALNEGSTRAQAAAQAGLTRGQINYWITKFRKARLEIFPAPQVDELEIAAEATMAVVIELEKEAEPVAAKVDSAVEPTKDTKAKWQSCWPLLHAEFQRCVDQQNRVPRHRCGESLRLWRKPIHPLPLFDPPEHSP